MSANRLCLGTAQFGSAYGVANTSGKVREDDARLILDVARGEGVRTLDTAISYGDSEETLGRIGLDGWQVITKIPALPSGIASYGIDGWLSTVVAGSLARLRVPRLNGLLLHKPSDLLGEGGRALVNAMRGLKERQFVDRLGVSVYAPTEIAAYQQHMAIDLVQIPFNVFDRRLESSGLIDRLADSSIAIHARSVFLQGLLLMARDNRPQFSKRWSHVWAKWDSWLQETGLSALEACLTFVLARDSIERVVVGIDNVMHLRQILRSVGKAPLEVPDFDVTDVELLNPALWAKA